MGDVQNILNDDEFFGDIVDTPKKGITQHKKREYLKSTISEDKALGTKKQWTHERIDKASDEVINKPHAEYRQCELNEKGEKTGKALGKHVIDLHSPGISRMVEIRDVHKLRQGIENDPTIKDQMAGLGCLLVCTFGNFLASVLVAAHTVNNLDLANELENEDYKSD